MFVFNSLVKRFFMRAYVINLTIKLIIINQELALDKFA